MLIIQKNFIFNSELNITKEQRGNWEMMLKKWEHKCTPIFENKVYQSLPTAQIFLIFTGIYEFKCTKTHCHRNSIVCAKHKRCFFPLELRIYGTAYNSIFISELASTIK